MDDASDGPAPVAPSGAVDSPEYLAQVISWDVLPKTNMASSRPVYFRQLVSWTVSQDSQRAGRHLTTEERDLLAFYLTNSFAGTELGDTAGFALGAAYASARWASAFRWIRDPTVFPAHGPGVGGGAAAPGGGGGAAAGGAAAGTSGSGPSPNAANPLGGQGIPWLRDAVWLRGARAATAWRVARFVARYQVVKSAVGLLFSMSAVSTQADRVRRDPRLESWRRDVKAHQREFARERAARVRAGGGGGGWAGAGARGVGPTPDVLAEDGAGEDELRRLRGAGSDENGATASSASGWDEIRQQLQQRSQQQGEHEAEQPQRQQPPSWTAPQSRPSQPPSSARRWWLGKPQAETAAERRDDVDELFEEEDDDGGSPVSAAERRAARAGRASATTTSSTAAATDDAGTGADPGSAWERVRQQARTDANGRQQWATARWPENSSSGGGGSGSGSTNPESAGRGGDGAAAAARERAQREFDALVEAERKGGSGSA